MRYITDSDGYVKEVSFGAMIVCGGQGCTEYTGAVPSGYSSLIDWFTRECETLYRWRIVGGNLTLDSSVVVPDSTRVGYLTSADDLNKVTAEGCYCWDWADPPANAPSDPGTTYMREMRVWSGHSGAEVYQEVADMSDSNYQGALVRRTMYGSKAYPWEWVNPPMILETEYRTTERYNGKPVYAKLFNFGTLPNASYKDVSFCNHTDCRPISVDVQAGSGYSNLYTTIPIYDGTATVSAINYNTIRIYTTVDRTAMYARILVKYWKTTD